MQDTGSDPVSYPDQPSLVEIFEGIGVDRQLRNSRIHEAVTHYGYTLTAIHRHIGLNPSTLSRIVKGIEKLREDARYRL